MTPWISDPNTKQPSVTLTAFCIGFGIACLKLIGSGIQAGPVILSQFTGGDFAAVVGAVGAIYWARRNAGNTDDKSSANG